MLSCDDWGSIYHDYALILSRRFTFISFFLFYLDAAVFSSSDQPSLCGIKPCRNDGVLAVGVCKFEHWHTRVEVPKTHGRVVARCDNLPWRSVVADGSYRFLMTNRLNEMWKKRDDKNTSWLRKLSPTHMVEHTLASQVRGFSYSLSRYFRHVMWRHCASDGSIDCNPALFLHQTILIFWEKSKLDTLFPEATWLCPWSAVSTIRRASHYSTLHFPSLTTCDLHSLPVNFRRATWSVASARWQSSWW